MWANWVVCIFSLSKLLGFSKGYKEAFMSGDQEPWVFRGGLQAELQVCMRSKINLETDKFEKILTYLPVSRAI